METAQTNLLEFIGIEENNLLVSMITCHRDIALGFPNIDGVFKAPIKHLNINVKDDHKNIVVALYLYTHYHMYFSIVCLLRCHLSESLASTRKAIDATLTAYRLITEPETLTQYVNREKDYKSIKAFIGRKRREDSKVYPLAETLLEFHDICSEYGSHADISSLVQRIVIEGVEGADIGQFKVNMFQIMDSDLEERKHMVDTFLVFTSMLKVFSGFISGLATGLDSEDWNKKIDNLTIAILKEVGKIRAELETIKAKAAQI